jgi:hypothetical protein
MPGAMVGALPDPARRDAGRGAGQRRGAARAAARPGAPWWIPDAVMRLPKMPLASTGKIDKMRLRGEYGGG